MKLWLFIAVLHTTLAVVKLRPEKKFRPEWDWNVQPLWYRRKALPTELQPNWDLVMLWVHNLPIEHANEYINMKYHIFSIHLRSSPSTGWYITKSPMWPSPSWLDSSVRRSLHRYRRGHRFESYSGLKFFQALNSQPLKLCVTLQRSIRTSYVSRQFNYKLYFICHLHNCMSLFIAMSISLIRT